MLIDSHAHIHFDDYSQEILNVLDNAKQVGIEAIITVGTNQDDSQKAIDFALNANTVAVAKPIKLYATAGIHPHDASNGREGFEYIKVLIENKKYKDVLVAIGECGLDYFKNLSSKHDQTKMLEWQLELAMEYNLPVVFHVRDAWQDYFAILKNYPDIRGVIHSFTGSSSEIEQALQYNLYFGLNGIVTFTKDFAQLEAIKNIPNQKILLETDCPFLTPVPHRGKRNEPSYLSVIGKFLAELKNEDYTELTTQFTANTKELFSI